MREPEFAQRRSTSRENESARNMRESEFERRGSGNRRGENGRQRDFEENESSIFNGINRGRGGNSDSERIGNRRNRRNEFDDEDGDMVRGRDSDMDFDFEEDEEDIEFVPRGRNALHERGRGYRYDED